jgi:adenine deaminase
LKKGAFASSVAHDSHNIVAVGVDDESIMEAVNLVIKEKGGVSAYCNKKEIVLGLPVAGWMVNSGLTVARVFDVRTAGAAARFLGACFFVDRRVAMMF